MARSASRDFVVKKNNVTIASVTSKSVTWNGTPIDVTSDDDAGATTYLADKFGTTTLEISAEGYTDDDVLSDLAFAATDAGKFLSDITLERSNGDVISGDFILTNYVETGGSPTDGTTFTATLVRNGIHTFTQA